jgi:hypothetical protein
MANHVLLNNIEHKNLRIITARGAQYGDNKMCSLVFPFEFKHVQAHYPIFFHKNNSTGEFSAVAMFGFEEGQNLFLNDNGWDADYIPLMVEREPFLIGSQETMEDGKLVKKSVIHIDLDSPRISETHGSPLFLEHGGNTDYLSRASAMLKTIEDSRGGTQLFFDAVKELALLEPFNLDITLGNGNSHRLSGYYTINQDKLGALSADTLEKLSQSGLLMILYMVIASQENIRSLAARKDKLSSK